MTQKKPSEVFLGLIYQSAPDLTPAEFAECAAAWRQIVSLEEIYAAAQAKDLADAAEKAAAKSEAGKTAMATSKRKCLEALDAARAAGTPLVEIAQAAAGLTLTDVMDALGRKPLPLTKLAALEKALAKLGATAPPPCPQEEGDGG